MGVAICIGLWAVGIFPSHASGAENGALPDLGDYSHLGETDAAAAVPVGRSGQ